MLAVWVGRGSEHIAPLVILAGRGETGGWWRGRFVPGVSCRATDENQEKNPGCGGLAAPRPPPPGPSRSSRCAGEDTPQKLGAGELRASGALLLRLRVYSSISINPGLDRTKPIRVS